MELHKNYYRADNGKHFVLTKIGKMNVASYHNKVVGEPVSTYATEAVKWAVDEGYLEEVSIPGWTKLIGFEAVYYNKKCRIPVGNARVYPIRKAAEALKRHYESYPWFDHDIVIEEVEYEGVPLNESMIHNGKEVIDLDHYFGLDACEIGDYFAEDIINQLVNMLPPVCMRSNYIQIGGSISHEMNENGKNRPTYATFKRISENIFEYCGNCFCM